MSIGSTNSMLSPWRPRPPSSRALAPLSPPVCSSTQGVKDWTMVNVYLVLDYITTSSSDFHIATRRVASSAARGCRQGFTLSTSVLDVAALTRARPGSRTASATPAALTTVRLRLLPLGPWDLLLQTRLGPLAPTLVVVVVVAMVMTRVVAMTTAGPSIAIAAAPSTSPAGLRRTWTDLPTSSSRPRSAKRVNLPEPITSTRLLQRCLLPPLLF